MKNGRMTTRFIEKNLQKSPKSVLLLGPRQVGKTTLVESLNPDLSINLADESEYRQFITNPEELRQRLDLTSPQTVFIDEIQRLPELLNTIQTIIDQKKNKIKFFLTGSSARKLKRGSANLLPGRIFSYRLGPLSLLDLNFKMDTEQALEVGCLPEPYLMNQQKLAQKLLQTYTATYLREEILAETLVRDLQGFSHFLNAVAENSGLFLDLSKIATKARVNRSAARRYYEILEDTLLCDRLESYFDSTNPELSKKLVKHSKYYLFDLGIKNAVLQNFKASNDRIGFLFEHLFFNQIKNISYSLDQEIKVSHFRTHTGLELDFIFNIHSKNIIVELKTSEPSADEVKKIEGVAKEFHIAGDIYVACIRCKPKKIGKTKILHWQDVLKEITERFR